MIDFPSSPTVGQVFNSGSGPVYIWDGVAWSLVGPLSPAGWEPIGVYDFTALGTSGQLIQNLGAFRDLRIGIDYNAAGSIGMSAQFSADNGSTFLTSTSYVRAEVNMLQLPSANVVGGIGSDSALSFGTVQPQSGMPAMYQTEIRRFNKAFNKVAMGGWHSNNGTSGNSLARLGHVITSAVAYNSFKFFTSSGTADGRLVLEGIRG